MVFHHHHLHLHLLFFTLIFLPPTISGMFAADRDALLLLQTAVGGRTFRWNASTANPCSSWVGVRCDAADRVIGLRLPGSALRGTIPPNSIGNLTGLQVLSLRENSLSSELPSDLAACTQLQEIHLQGNNFSGEIPAGLFSLINVSRLNLARNSFSGDLSSGFDNLTNLRILYLENNRFTGSLPDWNALNQLRQFNVSFNGLTGNIPSRLATFPSTSFMATSLCGGPLASCNDDGGNSLSGGAIAGIAVGSLAALLLILIVIFISYKTYWRKPKILPRIDRSPVPRSPSKPLQHQIQSPQPSSVAEYSRASLEGYGYRGGENRGSDGLVFFGEYVEAFTLEDLLTASAEAIGKGRVGSTYKAYFESGIEVIVKRLKNVSVSEQEFRSKIEEVGSLIHENLEPLRGYFYGRDEKLLLYEPMARGSLSQLLHGDQDGSTISREIRARIAHGAASAIEYLHSISTTTTHGNIKSSNIFIVDYYNARVSEFGLTQLVSSSSYLNGYRAPEVMNTRWISQKADVYSFGVVVLELVTGKEPDSILTEEGVDLPNWVRSALRENRMIHVFDPQLVRSEAVDEPLVQLFHVALSCTSQDPERRPSMVEVRQSIEEICS